MIKRFWLIYEQAKPIGILGRMRVVWNALRLQIDQVRGRRVILRRIHGNRMLLDLNRAGIAHELAIWGGREELETRVFWGAIKKGMVVVDLGANIGYYTLLAATLVGPRGKVYAIEPLPANYSTLTRNVELNNFATIVEPHQLAISDRDGDSRFFLGQADNLGTLLDHSKNTGKENDFITVKTTTLDTFLNGRGIDFLRMDIEGSECEVFDGMPATFHQNIPPRILFEVHPTGKIDPDPRFTPHFRKLLDLGYYPRVLVSSSNPLAMPHFSALGYTPLVKARSGQALYENIKPEDLISVGARRPKVTRTLYLVHKDDNR